MNKKIFCHSSGNFKKSFRAFRKNIEKEGIELTDSDFENLRDKSVGRYGLEWLIEEEENVVHPIWSDFLKYQDTVKTGKGDIQKDIQESRKIRAASINEK